MMNLIMIMNLNFRQYYMMWKEREENVVNIMVNHIYLILPGKIYLRVVVYLLSFQHQKDGLK